jgi:Ran GTPase-activating protein (RanGAP) involved in mRNA processing and transport
MLKYMTRKSKIDKTRKLRANCYSESSLTLAIKHHAVLTLIQLYKVTLGPRQVKYISHQLLRNTLTFLSLDYCVLRPEDTIIIAQSLACNTSLKLLLLRHNPIQQEGVCALAEALQQNTVLETLILRDNAIGPEGACSLARALQHNIGLTRLLLCQNFIGPTGAAAFAKLLQHNKILTNLYLEGNHILLEGAEALAIALQDNTVLSSLSLKGNHLGPEGATVAIAEALQHNNTLISLMLGDNSLGLTDVTAIAKALRHNTVLTSLDLSRNDLGTECRHTLANAMQHNSSLLYLEFHRYHQAVDHLPSRIEVKLHINKQRATWISADKGLQRACIAGICKRWPKMTAEEQVAFANNARLLPYLIRSSAMQQAKKITRIGLFADNKVMPPTQICVDSGLCVSSAETARFHATAHHHFL